MTLQKEHERNQWPLLADMLSKAYPDVDTQLWKWWDTYLQKVFSGFLKSGINPEMVKIIMTSSAVKQIVSPNPRYQEVREAMNALASEGECPHLRSAQRRQMIFQDTKPDVDFAIVQFDGGSISLSLLDTILKSALHEEECAPTLDVFPIPTNPRVSIYNFLTTDPSGMHFQAFNYIIWGAESSDGIDKRLGSAVPWGSQPSLDLIPTSEGIRILSSSIRNTQEALDRPLHYSMPGNLNVFNELEVGLRGIRGKALHNPELKPFDTLSEYELSLLFQIGALELGIPVEQCHYSQYDAAVALYLREVCVTALACRNNFQTLMFGNSNYGYHYRQFVQELAHIQGSEITDEGWKDAELFARQLLGIPLTNSSPNQTS